MNVFKELALSVCSLKSYEKFLKDRKAKVFLFGFLLLVLYYIITIAVPIIRPFVMNGGFEGIIDKYIPDFELSDGRLWVDKEIEYDKDGIYVYINTSPDYQLYDAAEIAPYLRGYSSVIVMDSEKAIVKSGFNINEIYFSDMSDASFSRMDLMRFAPYAYLFIWISLAIVFVIMGIGVFLGALIVALIGMIVASCMNCRLTFGQLYILALHARTPALLIKAILSFLPFSIPFFFIINFVISVLYLVGAINRMKTPNITKPIEFTTYDSGYGGDWNNFK